MPLFAEGVRPDGGFKLHSSETKYAHSERLDFDDGKWVHVLLEIEGDAVVVESVEDSSCMDLWIF